MSPFKRDWRCECGFVSHDVDTTIKDLWCPMCGKPMEKVWTPPVTILKGNGWTPRFHK